MPMIHDLHSHFEAQALIEPAVLDDDNTEIEIDLQNYTAVGILLHVGAGGITFNGSNKVEFKLSHGDTSGSLAAIDVNDIEGVAAAELDANGALTSGIIKSLTAAHATAATYLFSYVGGKRYIELLADFSGTHGTGTPLYASVFACPMFTTNVASPKTGVAA